MADEWIRPGQPRRLTGDEPFRGVDATVRDFWAYAMSDLLMNNVRGYLAEFLVAKAVGASGCGRSRPARPPSTTWPDRSRWLRHRTDSRRAQAKRGARNE